MPFIYIYIVNNQWYHCSVYAVYFVWTNAYVWKGFHCDCRFRLVSMTSCSPFVRVFSSLSHAFELSFSLSLCLLFVYLTLPLSLSESRIIFSQSMVLVPVSNIRTGSIWSANIWFRVGSAFRKRNFICSLVKRVCRLRMMPTVCEDKIRDTAGDGVGMSDRNTESIVHFWRI